MTFEESLKRFLAVEVKIVLYREAQQRVERLREKVRQLGASKVPARLCRKRACQNASLLLFAPLSCIERQRRESSPMRPTTSTSPN